MTVSFHCWRVFLLCCMFILLRSPPPPLLLPGRRPLVLPQRVVDDGEGREAADGAHSPHAGQCSGQAETIQRGCQQVQGSRPAAKNSAVQGE